MKYDLDNELKGMALQTAPKNLGLYPVLNKILKLWSLKSDNAVDVREYTIDGYMEGKIKCFLVEPKGSEGKASMPCVVLYHGGGFLIGASSSHYEIAKLYAVRANCKVLFTDYRLAPKYPFPIPAEDCYLAYKWAYDNAKELGIDNTKMFVAGDSAGGNLSAAVALMLRDRGDSIPCGALLIYPVTDRRMLTESMKKFTDTPVWDANLSKLMWEAYLNGNTTDIQYASPMEAETLECFPKTYMEVAEFDCLHDEGVEFAKRLESSNVEVELHEVKKTCHGYESALKSQIMKTALERRVEWIKKIL